MKKSRAIVAVLGFSVGMVAYQNCSQQLSSVSVEQSSVAPTPTPLTAPSFSSLTGFSTAGNDRVYAVAQGGDLSLYYAGFVQSDITSAVAVAAASRDAVITKLSPTGQLLWSKSYGGAAEDQFFAMIVTSDGNLLAAGLSRSFVTGATDNDALLVKVSSDTGMVLWSQRFRTPGHDYLFNVRELSTGGFVAVGASTVIAGGKEDALILRTDASGVTLWSKVIGGTVEADRFTDLLITTQAGVTSILAGGYTQSYGLAFLPALQREGMLVRFSDAGVVEWSRIIGGSVEDRIHGLTDTADHSTYVIALKSDLPTSGGADTVVAKLSLDGSTQTAVSIATANFDEPYEILRSADGGFVVSSQSANSTDPATATDMNVRLSKVSADFSTLVWNREYGRADRDDGNFQSLIERKDGGFAMGMISKGYSASEDAMIVQTDAEGKINSTFTCSEVLSPAQALAPASITNAAFAPNVSGNLALARTSPTLTVNNLVPTQINACVP